MMLRSIKKLITDTLGVTAIQKMSSLNIGQSVVIDPKIEINAGCLSIGDYSYIGGAGRISSLPETKITIGKFTSIASGVQIIGALHKNHITNYSLSRLLPKEDRDRHQHGKSKGDISIGNDVWIGTNAIILSGVSIGDGAIIGAGSVVNKNIPPYSVCAGVPAKVKKMRFTDHEIELLLKLQWWNWPIDKIFSLIDEFYDENISPVDFIARSGVDIPE